LGGLVRISNGLLGARVDSGEKTDDVSVTPPASKDRGAENQLYRVEIHCSGVAGEARFRRSRDNGGVATASLGVEGSEIRVQTRAALQREIGSSRPTTLNELLGNPGTLVQLVKVEGNALSVDPATAPADGCRP
jgi:hypothetical protein